MKKNKQVGKVETVTTPKTKMAQVKQHLIKKKHITSWEAIKLYKATRLSAIIFNLRQAGYNISTKPVQSKDENGNSVTYAKYILISMPK